MCLVSELPVQVCWCRDEEVDKEGLCEQDAGPGLQQCQTHRPGRERGTD